MRVWRELWQERSGKNTDRPVFVITDAKEGAKGSGRSIEAYYMYEKLHECEELLDKYGGHKMAADCPFR